MTVVDGAPVRLPEFGFVRLSSILGPGGPIPISRSSWWAGVKAGRYPRPVKLGPRMTAWRVEDIRVLINNPEFLDNSRRRRGQTSVMPRRVGDV
jgi:prophage regulatory protein